MSTSNCPDFYDVLMVPTTADADSVRTAFRTLIRNSHPDCAGQGGSRDQAARIIEAYRTLSHPERRQQYDRRRNQRVMPPGSDRRRGERRQILPRTRSIRQAIDRRHAILWVASAGASAALALATFLPTLLISTNPSRDVLRALM